MEATKEPEIITDKTRMRNWSRAMRSQGKTIALVPTMGYLHHGHLSLVKEAHKFANLIVVSIYINPGQFSPSEDLSTYPSDFHGDILKLMSVPGGVDVIFHPHNLYDYTTENKNYSVSCSDSGDNCRNLEGKEVVSCVEDKGMGHETWVRVERLEKGLCGKSRPAFFRGVATIVTKLFNIVEPDFAVFGKKDYQQWRIIQRMVRDLDFSIKIIGTEVMRDSDGLAMSSRNVHLSPEEREKALSISRSLFKAKSCAEKGQTNCRELRDLVVQAVNEAGGKIDYAECIGNSKEISSKADDLLYYENQNRRTSTACYSSRLPKIVDQGSLEAAEEIKSSVVFCVAAWFGKVRLIDNVEINL